MFLTSSICCIPAVPGADPSDSLWEPQDAESCTQCPDPRCSLRHAELRTQWRAWPRREGGWRKLHQVSRRGKVRILAQLGNKDRHVVSMTGSWGQPRQLSEPAINVIFSVVLLIFLAHKQTYSYNKNTTVKQVWVWWNRFWVKLNTCTNQFNSLLITQGPVLQINRSRVLCSSGRRQLMSSMTVTTTTTKRVTWKSDQ